MKIKRIMSTLIFIVFLAGCSENNGMSSNQPAIYDASGRWTFTFTQTKTVDGDYIECGSEPVPKRSFTITQNGNDVSLVDKNGEVVNGSINGESYEFDFKELESNYDEDYIDYHLKFKLSSETSFSGTYRMDARDFFTDYNMTFFCITEGTLAGSKPEG